MRSMRIEEASIEASWGLQQLSHSLKFECLSFLTKTSSTSINRASRKRFEILSTSSTKGRKQHQIYSYLSLWKKDKLRNLQRQSSRGSSRLVRQLWVQGLWATASSYWGRERSKSQLRSCMMTTRSMLWVQRYGTWLRTKSLWMLLTPGRLIESDRYSVIRAFSKKLESAIAIIKLCQRKSWCMKLEFKTTCS